ncbi:MAG: leucyl aminopeptidase family protein [Proteobacteria bacterium]|nr:leucyl aminopeptidase family protein [Pseudomonadota bacterium]
MIDQTFDCLAPQDAPGLPLHAVRAGALDAFLAGLPAGQADFLRQTGFAAAPGDLALLAGEAGLAGAAFGLGDEAGPFAFGALPTRLPAGTVWRLEGGPVDAEAATLGFCLGAYRYAAFHTPSRAPARLVPPPGGEAALIAARAVCMARDLINAPANVLGPAELAGCAAALAEKLGAACTLTSGEALDAAYPTVSAVGRAAARKPAVATLRWAGSGAGPDAPLVSLCGKGVCFDSGGLDIKPASGMLRMKKDMGGAAVVLGIARMVMESDLPVRLAVRIGCVENAIAGDAMRPLDVIRTRSGLSVEIGNTDAEGRLVLCDLMAEACEESPALLVDCATLTGAARVALGPDLPALFCNDDHLAEAILRAGNQAADPLWRLPLWPGYASWLNSPVADLNNVSTKPLAGAIVAALFLQRFVRPGIAWAHVDLYAWNDSTGPGRPEGGEGQAIRAIHQAIRARFVPD